MCVSSRPYVELMNFLLKCGEGVKLWVGWRLRGQCEQHWGMLCSSFGGGCPLNQSHALQNTTVVPSVATGPWSTPEPLQQPTAAAQLDKSLAHNMDNGTGAGLQVSEKVNVSMS